MATPPSMPARGHSTAPKFEGNNARELRRYFDEIEHLFTQCAVTDNDPKKKFLIRYVDIDTEDSWRQIAEFGNALSTYDELKNAILKLYPGADGERIWTFEDLDNLTGQWARIGIRHKEDLGDYHRKFLAITAFLKSKRRLSDNEIKRAFVRGFRNELWSLVLSRLRIKTPDHHPDDPWDVSDVFDATIFVLHGTSSFSPMTPANIQPPPPPDTGIKKEEFLTILQQFSQTIVKALEAKSSSSDSAPKRKPCFYDGCDQPRSCEKLKDHLEKGLAIKNEEGRIALPNGSRISNSITGKNLAERVENWNKDNPGSTKKGTMLFSISPHESPSPHDPTHSYTVREPPTRKIEELEREIYELKKRQVTDAAEIPRQTRQQAKQARQDAESSNPKPVQPSSPPQQPKPQQKKPAVASPPKETQPERPTDPPATEPEKSSGPIHPFAAAAENRYLPPHERNFAAKPNKDKDFAYRTSAPIQSAAIVSDIFQKTMKSQCVTLTPEEIMAIAPDVRTKIREQITPKRVLPKPQQATNVYNDIEEPSLPFENEEPIEVLVSAETKTSAEFYPTNDTKPPDDAIIIPDPVEMYLQSLSPDEIPKQFVVAKDSHSLRSIMMKVNFRDSIECIVDGGCQIISMSEAVCHHLRLAYDPTIFLTMESANGSCDRSLGLARNVHCKIGGINLYFQIHVIRNPAYDMLIGRPFDVLTQSIVHNYSNSDQTITIHDPNSRQIYTIPTFPRSRPRFRLPDPNAPNPSNMDDSSEQDFYHSRN
jgi:hypothetical protein